MPVGTRILKERWHLDYERDGRTDEFPYLFYCAVLSMATALTAWGLLKLRM
jgi:hypothetical protein